MNKKFYFISLLMINLLFATAQTTYEFTKSSKTYTDLVGATSLNGDEVWDDPEYKIKMPFGFKLFDTPIGDSLYFTNLFGGGEFGTKDDTVSGTMNIVTYGADLVDRGDVIGISSSPISYLVEGKTPNRILKIEFKNAGFFNESDSLNSTNDFVNFQVWLYETSEKIEMHYGESKITNALLNFDDNLGPVVNISDTIFGYAGLSGNASNPTNRNEDTAFTTLIGTPPNGTVYTFKKATTSLKNITSFNGNIYPNPVSDQLIIEPVANNSIKSIRITNVSGQTIYKSATTNLAFNSNYSRNVQQLPYLRINTTAYKSGVYSVIITNFDGTHAAINFIKL